MAATLTLGLVTKDMFDSLGSMELIIGLIVVYIHVGLGYDLALSILLNFPISGMCNIEVKFHILNINRAWTGSCN